MLKNWSIRKNVTEEQWAVLWNKIRKRKRKGKESDVFFGVTHIGKKKLKNGSTRYVSLILKVPRMISFIS